MRPKLIACDLDDTLLDAKHRVQKDSCLAIRRALEAGNRFVIATGRPYNSVDDVLEAVGLLGKPGEYVISLNGGVVAEHASKTVIMSTPLDPVRANALYLEGRQHNVCLHIYTADTCYVHNYIDDERAYIAGRMNIKELTAPSLEPLGAEPVIKILYMNKDRSYLDGIRSSMGDLLDGIDVTYSSGRYMEFNPKGVGKGSGLLFLADKLGFAREDTLAIGDNSNDISMIQAAGVGAAVANASDDLKNACAYVATRSNEAGGVAEVIERFVLFQ